MHRIRQEYRAAATLDREHDEADRASGRRIGCPILALWSDRGALTTCSEAPDEHRRAGWCTCRFLVRVHPGAHLGMLGWAVE